MMDESSTTAIEIIITGAMVFLSGFVCYRIGIKEGELQPVVEAELREIPVPLPHPEPVYQGLVLPERIEVDPVVAALEAVVLDRPEPTEDSWRVNGIGTDYESCADTLWQFLGSEVSEEDGEEFFGRFFAAPSLRAVWLWHQLALLDYIEATGIWPWDTGPDPEHQELYDIWLMSQEALIALIPEPMRTTK